MLPKLGRYETLKKIASGGMATVYLGRVVGEGGFERLVALKVMHPHIANDPDFVAMFLDEARLAAKIRHPNVVATIDIQKTKDAMFLVMDYVDGPTLQEVRKHLKAREERLPIGICLRFFIDILNGLQEAHDLIDKDGNPLNLVHRDVSPHNVLIGQDGRAQLTDFGVAKAEARISSTRGGQLKGKIAYMPPEQIIAQPVDRRADVYSAGVCMWESLVGKRLFRAANDGALVHMILEGKPAPPSKYCDDIPPVIEGVLMKAISRKAEHRYDEAVDFAEALEDAAREAKIKIPRQRAVGKFIKEIVGELGRAPISTRSLTPPSAPSVRTGSASQPGMHSAPQSSPHGARPLPAAGAPPPQSANPSRGGPPPIPDLGTDPSIPNRKLPRPRADAHASGSLPRAPLPPTGAKLGGPPPPPPPKKEEAPDARSERRQSYDIEDPPTEVILPDQSMQDLVNSSQPSAVTSPTQIEASYSLMPPPNRHGVIAVGVAGAFLLAILIAVFVGGNPAGDSTNLSDPAAPLPDFSDGRSANEHTPAPPPAPPAPPPPSASVAPSGSAGTVDPAPSPSPIMVPRPGSKKRRKKAAPDPEPGKPFKPKGL